MSGSAGGDGALCHNQEEEGNPRVYITEGLGEKLRAIPLEGMTVDGVSDAVKQACGKAGKRLATSQSRRSKGAEPRLVLRQLRCPYGMPNRQVARAANGGGDGGKTVRPRKSLRIGCPFSVTIRWPMTGPRKDHPYLADGVNKLYHNHSVDNGVATLLPESTDQRREYEQEPGADRRKGTESLRTTPCDSQKPRGPEEEANEERRDNVRARILRCQHGQALAKETCDILVDMWHKGELKDGTDSLGDGFGCLDNGLFYGFLSRDNAPPYNVRRREDDGDSFWSKGEARRRHSDRVFRACLTAGFPVLIEGDITRSVMGAVCKAAVGMHISKLRNLGVRRGTSMFSLSEEFVDCWVEGNVGDNMLRDAFGGKTTWTIQNFEENQRVDACSYQTIECAAATGIVRKTRMGALCYPDTADTAGTDNTGGELTKPVSIGEVLWAGSEVTAFATRRGSVTHIHVDALEVNEKPLFLPAAGAMRSVNRGDRGPAKRAIVVCAHDMDRVVRLFKLDVRKPPAMQYGGAVSDLRRLAAELKANSIGFVVIDFPEACSYAIPGKCAHMSVTLRLVETCAWNPALPF